MKGGRTKRDHWPIFENGDLVTCALGERKKKKKNIYIYIYIYRSQTLNSYISLSLSLYDIYTVSRRSGSLGKQTNKLSSCPPEGAPYRLGSSDRQQKHHRYQPLLSPQFRLYRCSPLYYHQDSEKSRSEVKGSLHVDQANRYVNFESVLASGIVH